MITTTTSTPLADSYYKQYVTYDGTFYSGSTVSSKDLNMTTGAQTFTYDFARADKPAPKETSMFTTRIHQYIDGRFGVDVLYKDKIVQSSGRTWRRYEKAQAAGEDLIAAAVAKLFEQ